MHSPLLYAEKNSINPMNGIKHILITGFYDWHHLGVPPNVKRCRDNPSCRVLANEGIDHRGFNGPLAKLIKKWSKEEVDKKVTFALLPVTWSSLDQLDHHRFHTIIHLGLGVYDSYHRILIENGAYNLHHGTDALGEKRESLIQAHKPEVLKATSVITDGIKRALRHPLPQPFNLIQTEARRDNTYLCNATYYNTLLEVRKHPELNKEAYFIHIPHREGKSDQALSQVLFEIIKALLIK